MYLHTLHSILLKLLLLISYYVLRYMISTTFVVLSLLIRSDYTWALMTYVLLFTYVICFLILVIYASRVLSWIFNSPLFKNLKAYTPLFAILVTLSWITLSRFLLFDGTVFTWLLDSIVFILIYSLLHYLSTLSFRKGLRFLRRIAFSMLVILVSSFIVFSVANSSPLLAIESSDVATTSKKATPSPSKCNQCGKTDENFPVVNNIPTSSRISYFLPHLERCGDSILPNSVSKPVLSPTLTSNLSASKHKVTVFHLINDFYQQEDTPKHVGFEFNFRDTHVSLKDKHVCSGVIFKDQHISSLHIVTPDLSKILHPSISTYSYDPLRITRFLPVNLCYPSSPLICNYDDIGKYIICKGRFSFSYLPNNFYGDPRVFITNLKPSFSYPVLKPTPLYDCLTKKLYAYSTLSNDPSQAPLLKGAPGYIERRLHYLSKHKITNIVTLLPHMQFFDSSQIQESSHCASSFSSSLLTHLDTTRSFEPYAFFDNHVVVCRCCLLTWDWHPTDIRLVKSPPIKK